MSENSVTPFILSQGAFTPYKYKVLISQSGAFDPEAIILENTIGDIVWSRNASGDYLGTLAGAFPDPDKVWVSLNLNQIGDFKYSTKVASANTIQIQTEDGGFSSDDVLSGASLLIEVYS